MDPLIAWFFSLFLDDIAFEGYYVLLEK